MRYSAIAIAPFVAAALAKDASSETAPSSTYTYSNTMTNFLTMTNSLGVVTGMPSLAAGVLYTQQPEQPAVFTSQPAPATLATIPAGLPTGLDTVYIGGGPSQTVSSFFVSVGSSTTQVVGGAVATGASLVTGPASAAGPSASGAVSGDGGSTPSGTSGDNTPSGTSSSSSETSSGAASSIKMASGAVLGLGALFAALL